MSSRSLNEMSGIDFVVDARGNVSTGFGWLGPSQQFLEEVTGNAAGVPVDGAKA